MLSLDQFQQLLQGARVTGEVTFYAAILGTILGVAGGIASSSGFRPLRWLVRVYVEFFRGVSAIILLFWAFFSLPQLFDVNISQMQAGALALGTNMGAYAVELVRGAIAAVPEGQREAATAVSLTPFQRMRHVVFPQALVVMLPPYGNLLIEVMKASALVSLIAMRDIVFEAQNIRVNRGAEGLAIFAGVFLIYLVIAGVITLVVRTAERFASRGVEVGR